MNAALLLSPFASIVPLVAPASDWPQFRGEHGNGVAPAANLPLSWSEGEHVAWKTRLPGSGWSQPIVIGNLVFVTAAAGEGLAAPITFQKGVDAPDTSKDAAPDVEIDWQVLAFDLANGAQRWTRSAAHGKPRFVIHPSNTYASETPAADARGVYAYFGATGTVAAFDHAGAALWKVELGAYPTDQGFGTGSSPAIHDGALFVQCFSEERSFLVCLDTKTGAEAWRVTRDPSTAWSSPLVWSTAKRTEVIASGKKLIASYDVKTGKELWHAAGVDVPDSSSLTADAERLYFGFRGARVNGPLYALQAGAEGDLSPKSGASALGHQAWAKSGSAPGMPSPVVANGFVFTVSGGFLSCYDALTGEQKFKERLEGLGMIAASPIAVGEKLLVIDEVGAALVLRAGPSYEVLGRGDLDDVFWATPTVAGDSLLLRGVESLYCVRS